MKKDNIYKKDKIGSFEFDDKVAEVFPDMLERSIPGYEATINTIKALASNYVKENSNCYDLGCSLGAATIAMRRGIKKQGCKIFSIDNSESMISRCEKIFLKDKEDFQSNTKIHAINNDICDIQIKNASMVVLNFTLQFIQKEKRSSVIDSIYNGLNKGGILVLSEKVIDENKFKEKLLVELHHTRKKNKGYSAKEIIRKQASLKNILTPETVNDHQNRLNRAGFINNLIWLRYFNFISIIAIKDD
tara:strand:- start:7024 stop:7761 length:738 start_codon:yes stop_codon:yes gene_type:complete